MKSETEARKPSPEPFKEARDYEDAYYANDDIPRKEQLELMAEFAALKIRECMEAMDAEAKRIDKLAESEHIAAFKPLQQAAATAIAALRFKIAKRFGLDQEAKP